MAKRVANLRQVTRVRSPARPSITDNMPTGQRFPSQGGGILDVKCHQVYHVVRVRGKLCSFRLLCMSVADLGEGPRGPGPPLLVEYLRKIYKKMTEMGIQKPF